MSPVRGHGMNAGAGHGGEHAGAAEDSGEAAGGAEDGGHGDGGAGVVFQLFALQVDVGEVDDEGEDGAEHEADGGLNAAAESRAENGQGEDDVDEEARVVLGGIDLRSLLWRGCGGFAEAALFAAAKPE